MIQVAIDDEIVPPRLKENPKEDLQVRKKKKKRKDKTHKGITIRVIRMQNIKQRENLILRCVKN